MFVETTDQSPLSHVLRIVDEKEKPQERLFEYVDVSKDKKFTTSSFEIFSTIPTTSAFYTI